MKVSYQQNVSCHCNAFPLIPIEILLALLPILTILMPLLIAITPLQQDLKTCQASGIMLEWYNISILCGLVTLLVQLVLNMRYGSSDDVECYQASKDPPRR
jgi:hypothetical protein